MSTIPRINQSFHLFLVHNQMPPHHYPHYYHSRKLPPDTGVHDNSHRHSFHRQIMICRILNMIHHNYT
ncbi:hypothetical protein HMPREF1615_03255 [Escherichia coli 908632]|nr:hypothetical protein HMPREF1615_03255 [Escherichia coli 908632]